MHNLKGGSGNEIFIPMLIMVQKLNCTNQHEIKVTETIFPRRKQSVLKIFFYTSPNI